MILGSHNSWSYLPPKHWWMYPFRFMAKCQSKNIFKQYEQGTRCFDLRLKFKKDTMYIAHGYMLYEYTIEDLLHDLELLNDVPDEIYIRIIHEARTKKEYTKENIEKFMDYALMLKSRFHKLKFWCGKNLYNWETDYDFPDKPTCEEKYASVCKPKWLDDWWPWLFAKLNNKKILEQGTDKDILLIDFV